MRGGVCRDVAAAVGWTQARMRGVRGVCRKVDRRWRRHCKTTCNRLSILLSCLLADLIHLAVYPIFKVLIHARK